MNHPYINIGAAITSFSMACVCFHQEVYIGAVVNTWAFGVNCGFVIAVYLLKYQLRIRNIKL